MLLLQLQCWKVDKALPLKGILRLASLYQNQPGWKGRNEEINMILILKRDFRALCCVPATAAAPAARILERGYFNDVQC